MKKLFFYSTTPYSSSTTVTRSTSRLHLNSASLFSAPCFLSSHVKKPQARACNCWRVRGQTRPGTISVAIESNCSTFRDPRKHFSSLPLTSTLTLTLLKLIPKTIGNRKRDCAWGCAWGINTTWENLQIEKHKSVRWAEWTPSWFVLFDLQIFSGGVYSPSATSRTISFSISNSFWY